MRTVHEILLQPMPPNAALSDLAEELAVVGVEAAKGQLFVARLTELLADHPTLAQLMAMSASEVKAVEAAVKFSVCATPLPCASAWDLQQVRSHSSRTL